MSSLDPVDADGAQDGQGKGIVVGAVVVAVLALIAAACGIIYGVKANKAQTAAFAALDERLTTQVNTATAGMSTQFSELQSSTKAQLVSGLASVDSVAKSYSAEAIEVARTAERNVSDVSTNVAMKLAEASAANATTIDAMRTELASHKMKDEEAVRLTTETTRDLIKSTVKPEVLAALTPFTARQDSIERLIRKSDALDGVVKYGALALAIVGIGTGWQSK